MKITNLYLPSTNWHLLYLALVCFPEQTDSRPPVRWLSESLRPFAHAVGVVRGVYRSHRLPIISIVIVVSTILLLPKDIVVEFLGKGLPVLVQRLTQEIAAQHSA